MAGKFDKALGNSVIKKAGGVSRKNANVPKIEYIDINLLDENPDNSQIFNMEDINRLMKSIKDNGFTGAVEVFRKPDGRYEISSGHRRVRAMRELGRNRVPCLVNAMPDDIVRAKRLLDSNITNRVLKPLDYARSIEYYIDYVLKPSGFKGQVDEACAEYFGISKSAVYKYRSLLKMIPELSELTDSDLYPFTGFVSAHRLSEKKQKELAGILKSHEKTLYEKNGEPTPVGKSYIEETIRSLLKEEDNYRESQNPEIAEKTKSGRNAEGRRVAEYVSVSSDKINPSGKSSDTQGSDSSDALDVTSSFTENAYDDLVSEINNEEGSSVNTTSEVVTAVKSIVLDARSISGMISSMQSEEVSEVRDLLHSLQKTTDELLKKINNL